MRRWIAFEVLLLILCLLNNMTAIANLPVLPPEVARQRLKQQLHNLDSNLSFTPKLHLYFPNRDSARHSKKIQHSKSIAIIYSGSLRNNIERLAHQFGWKTVIWNANNDYQWIGETKIKAPSFADILTKLLQQYPLQANFYQGNHVLVMTARTLK